MKDAVIVTNGKGENIFKISIKGKIYYNYKGKLTKVKCHDDIAQAFQESVLQITGYRSEDVMIEKYLKKILNHERSDEYILKLESAFRKLKLQKLKNL